MNAFWKKILTAGFIVLALGAAFTWYIFTEKFTDTTDSKAQYNLSAETLIHEFEADEKKANAKYMEKIIAVSGVVSEVEHADSTVNIKFADSTSGAYIIFAFQEQHLAEAGKVKEGEHIIIKGSCSGGIYSSILETESVYFKRCALVE